MTGILMDKYRYGPPTASQFGTLGGTNSENPTLTDTTGRGLLIAFGTSPASGDNVRTALKSITLSGTQDIIARIGTSSPLFNFFGSGICVSDGTKLVTFAYCAEETKIPGVKVTRWTNATTFSSDRIAVPTLSYEWLRIGITTGKPTDFYISDNGTDWIKILNEDQSGFLTANKCGFVSFVNRNAGSFPVSATQQLYSNVLYYKDPDINPGF